MAYEMSEKLQKILAAAEQVGDEQSFLLVTTLKRYQVQLNMLTRLESEIKAKGDLVNKEYVKGRPNIAINPAITEYNKTATAANNTAQFLMRIISASGISLEIGDGDDEM